GWGFRICFFASRSALRAPRFDRPGVELDLLAGLQSPGDVGFDLPADPDVPPRDQSLGLRPAQPESQFQDRGQGLAGLPAVHHEQDRRHVASQSPMSNSLGSTFSSGVNVTVVRSSALRPSLSTTARVGRVSPANALKSESTSSSSTSLPVSGSGDFRLTRTK